MDLSEEEKAKISKQLKRANRYLWRDDVIEKVFLILSQLRDGKIKKSDYFVAGLLSYEDYLYQLNLIQFI